MPDPVSPFALIAALYVLAITVYIVSENRRPQSSFAWLLLFIFVPVGGLVIYVLFGRMDGGVGRTRTLTRHDLPGHLAQTLDRVEAEHAAALAEMAALPQRRERLARLVRETAQAFVTTSNRVTILQDASEKYPRLMDDMRGARTSIHLQYCIWQNDTVTAGLEAIMAERAAAGVEVRLLYDPVGSIGAWGPFRRRRLRGMGIDARPFSPLCGCTPSPIATTARSP